MGGGGGSGTRENKSELFSLQETTMLAGRNLGLVVGIFTTGGEIFVCGHRPNTKELLEYLLFFLFLFLLFLFTFGLIPHLNELKIFWLSWESNLLSHTQQTITQSTELQRP